MFSSRYCCLAWWAVQMLMLMLALVLVLALALVPVLLRALVFPQSGYELAASTPPPTVKGDRR